MGPWILSCQPALISLRYPVSKNKRWREMLNVDFWLPHASEHMCTHAPPPPVCVCRGGVENEKHLEETRLPRRIERTQSTQAEKPGLLQNSGDHRSLAIT